MTDQEKQSYVGTDFLDQVESWFQNKGILHKLELFLKNQRSCDQQSFRSESVTLSSKTQAIKVLIADFLLQEELLFSLSVFCMEYISHLADLKIDSINGKKVTKPKFDDEELLDVLEALNLNFKPKEFHVFYNIYKSGKTGSVLASLLGTIPKLIKKHRILEYLLKRARKKEKIFQKMVKIEKIKVKSMYSLVQRAYGAVEKHKADMRQFFQNQNEMKPLEQVWQTTLNVTEQFHGENCEEMEKRADVLEKQEFELQSKYQKVQQSMNELNIEHGRIKLAELQLESDYVDKTDKLQEFQEKFYFLQAEVQELLKNYNGNGSDTTCTENSPENLAENEVLNNMEEYVNSMEKENVLLKVRSNEQRCHIDQLTNEVSFLKSRLDHLEKEMQVCKHIEIEMQQRDVMHALLLSSKRLLPESQNRGDYVEKSIVATSRQKLFCEDETVQLSESSFNIAPRDTNLTDEIVADAKNEIKELENESIVLNRNFKSLQNILTRNIALSKSKNSLLSSLEGLLPRSLCLSKSYSDLDYGNMSANASSYASFALKNDHKFEASLPQVAQVPLSPQKFTSFRELFMKRKKERAHPVNSNHTVTEGSSSVCSLPGERDDNEVDSKEFVN